MEELKGTEKSSTDESLTLNSGVAVPEVAKERQEELSSTLSSELNTEQRKSEESLPQGNSCNSPDKDSFMLRNASFPTLFLEDQIQEDNFTDLDIICADGYVQVHRCLLMGASKFLCDLLIEKDILDTCAISIPDVSVCHLKQVLSLLYSGRTIIDKTDEGHILHVMIMLGFSMKDLLCRNAKESDVNLMITLRHISRQDDYEENDDVGSEQDNLNNGAELTVEVKDKGQDEADPSADQSDKGDYLNETEVKECIKEIPNTSHGMEDPHSEKDCSKVLNTKDLNSQLPSNTNETRTKYTKTKEVFMHVNSLPNETLQSSNNQKGTINKAEPSICNFIDTKDDLQFSNRVLLKSSNMDDDLSFEEACNDLEKQVEEQRNVTQAIKRKSIGCKCETGNGEERDGSNKDDLFGSYQSDKVKKKKVSSNEVEETILYKGSSSEKKSIFEEMLNSSSLKTEDANKQSKKNKGGKFNYDELAPQISTNHKIRTGNVQSSKGSGKTRGKFTTLEPIKTPNRVFLEAKEIKGVKYNFYGFSDPIKGVESGKTIAVIAKNDNSHRNE